MSYIHLTIEKRSQIEALTKEGYSTRKIAALIKVHHSTVARELNRIPSNYSAIKAQAIANHKSCYKGSPLKLTIKLADHILTRLKQHWSPEQIVSAELSQSICFKTIYTWLHKRLLGVDETCLRRKGRGKKTLEKRGKEFACYAKVESELNIPVYFADSHAPWQRGSNENSNGLLREFFPKKTNFSKVTNDELLDALLLPNHCPRKCLGLKKPFEMLLHEISKLE